ncbi:glycoside hydrolase family 2 TIM barrel-domain containing protein [Mucilaginibacter polytrichastri]|nr:glycoside hydrolase family 2 TIM barrel-domain containing protein [Mucilaginibacter polytrichastri]SFS79528.1 beta-galactosidase [Mucilaginibacter polytrichastri]
MKSVLTLFFLSLTMMVNAQNVVTASRKQLFDYDWKFSLDDEPTASQPSFNDAQWRKLNLPHDWSIEGQTKAYNPSGNDGGYFPTGTGWYRKNFRVPAMLKAKKISVYFEGVYMNSEVFINGKSIGVRPYGYSAFAYDITPYLNYNGDNVLVVKADNSKQKNSRWYSGSGIYRHVWLTVTDAVHIGNWGISIKTNNITKNNATVEIKTILKNETLFPKKVSLFTALTDKNKGEAGNTNTTITLPANETREVVQNVVVKNPLFWSCEEPWLYNARVTIKQGVKTVDETTTAFGIRSLVFSTQNGFQLNGKKIILNGGCAHHDNGILGAAAYDRAEEKKVELLKAAGFNAVRTSHNPPSEAFLNACDRLGLLVIDEAFDGWRQNKTPYDYAMYFDKWWQRDVETMVLRDRNHPSIFMWSIGNEIIERKKPEAIATATMMAKFIKTLDTTRPITSAMTTWDSEWEMFDPLFAAHDIAGYNYQLYRAPADHQRVPSRIIVQTESYPKDAFANWKLSHENSYIVGDFVWTAIDYLGESGIGRHFYPGDPAGEHYEKPLFPWHGAYCGDIDLTGWRKPISHYRELLYSNKEELYLAVKEPNPESGPIRLTLWAVWPTWESWTWPGFEGKDVQVEVYSKYPAVRLYLNDKLLGEQPTTQAQEFKATFTIPYTPGVIKAVAVKDGKEVETRILKTAGKAVGIKLTADRKMLSANAQDLSYITVEIVDGNGLTVPDANNQLSFQVTGEGTIAGVGNANLQDTDPYVGSQHKVWKGRAVVILKSTQKPGKLELQVSAPGLETASLIMNTISR